MLLPRQKLLHVSSSTTDFRRLFPNIDKLPFAVDEPIVASTSVNVEAVDKDTERIYDGMDSLAAEEQGKVHAHAEPASAIAPVLPIATISGTGKRSRDEEAENAHPSAPNGVGAAVAQAGERFCRIVHFPSLIIDGILIVQQPTAPRNQESVLTLENVVIRHVSSHPLKSAPL